MVRTGTKALEEVDRAEEVSPAEAVAITLTVAEHDDHKICIWRENKNSPISKLLITETGHRPTQFKKINHTLPVLCADKYFRGLNEVLQTGIDLVESNFMPTYPDPTQWLSTHQVEIQIVAPGAKVDATTGVCPFVPIVIEQTHVFKANIQKELLLQYKPNSKNKSLEYAKFLANKKALITIIFGRCDEATKTEIALGATYTVDRKGIFSTNYNQFVLAVMIVAYHMGLINKL